MFEDGKIWILLFLVGILISFGYISHYFGAVDDANLALQESKTKLRDLKEMIATRQRGWQEQEQIVAKIKVEADKNAALTKTKEDLDTRQRAAEAELSYSVESMKNAVEKVRGSANGTDLGEITLTTGKVLRAVKVRRVDDSGISVIHADGIGTIPPEQLPENLREKYDLGPNALLLQLQEAQVALSGKGVAKKD